MIIVNTSGADGVEDQAQNPHLAVIQRIERRVGNSGEGESFFSALLMLISYLLLVSFFHESTTLFASPQFGFPGVF
jgi:hypothetical protein